MYVMAIANVFPSDESFWDLGFPKVHSLVSIVLQRSQSIEVLEALSPLGAVKLTPDKDIFQKTVCKASHGAPRVVHIFPSGEF